MARLPDRSGYRLIRTKELTSGAVGLVARKMKRGEAKLMIKDSLNKVAEFALYFIRNRKKGKTDTCKIPVYVMKPGFYNTVEGCYLSNCGKNMNKAGLSAFRAMPYEMQRALEFAPKTGEFIERAQKWQEYLRAVAPGKDGHAAMVGILSWYRHLKHMRHNGGKNA